MWRDRRSWMEGVCGGTEGAGVCGGIEGAGWRCSGLGRGIMLFQLMCVLCVCVFV